MDVTDDLLETCNWTKLFIYGRKLFKVRTEYSCPYNVSGKLHKNRNRLSMEIQSAVRTIIANETKDTAVSAMLQSDNLLFNIERSTWRAAYKLMFKKGQQILEPYPIMLHVKITQKHGHYGQGDDVQTTVVSQGRDKTSDHDPGVNQRGTKRNLSEKPLGQTGNRYQGDRREENRLIDNDTVSKRQCCYQPDDNVVDGVKKNLIKVLDETEAEAFLVQRHHDKRCAVEPPYKTHEVHYCGGFDNVLTRKILGSPGTPEMHSNKTYTGRYNLRNSKRQRSTLKGKYGARQQVKRPAQNKGITEMCHTKQHSYEFIDNSKNLSSNNNVVERLDPRTIKSQGELAYLPNGEAEPSESTDNNSNDSVACDEGNLYGVASLTESARLADMLTKPGIDMQETPNNQNARRSSGVKQDPINSAALHEKSVDGNTQNTKPVSASESDSDPDHIDCGAHRPRLAKLPGNSERNTTCNPQINKQLKRRQPTKEEKSVEIPDKRDRFTTETEEIQEDMKLQQMAEVPATPTKMSNIPPLHEKAPLPRRHSLIGMVTDMLLTPVKKFLRK